MRTYTRTFSNAGQRWTCAFEVSLTATEMSWLPKCPPQSTPIWREYRRWRDRCLKDLGRRTGVCHEIRVDIPPAGLRDRTTYTVSREAAHAHARTCYDELTRAKVHEAQRETRDRGLIPLLGRVLPVLTLRRRLRSAVHGRPHFAKLSVHEGLQDQIAPVTTRRDPTGHVWGESQRITLPEALRSATLDGAYASFEEHDKGSIEPGKLADLVVLDQDPLTVPVEQWLDIKVERTMLGGNWVYEA